MYWDVNCCTYSRASGQLSAFKCIGRHLSAHSKLLVYKTFILSNFNYCPLVWNLCSEGNIQKMEKIQLRALRYIYKDFSNDYAYLLVKSGLSSLRVRNLRHTALQCFKILYGMTPFYLQNLLCFKQHNNSYSFRYCNTLSLPHFNTITYGKNSFAYKASSLWNSLPNEFRMETNFSAFKNLVYNFMSDTCNCTSCS